MGGAVLVTAECAAAGKKSSPRRIKVLTYSLVNWIITVLPSIRKGFKCFIIRKDIFMKTRTSHLTSPWHGLRPLVLAATACFVMLFTACTFAAVFEPNTVSTEPNKPEPNKPAETAVDSVAVTVNGVDIKESQVEAQLKPQLAKVGAQLPPAFVEQYKNQLKQQVLEGMIVEQLLDGKVKENNISKK
jgi:hypothetical protein